LSDRKLLFLQYYEEFKVSVYNYALKMLKDAEAAKDVTQETFTKFFERTNTIRDIAKIKVWIFTVARNEIYGIFRKQRKKSLMFADEEVTEPEVVDEGKSIEEKIELKELKEIIMDELEKISEKNKETFLLREYGGLTYKEIAEITESNVNLVKSRLFKTRQKLIQRISEVIK